MSILKLTLGESFSNIEVPVVVNVRSVSGVEKGKQNLVMSPKQEYNVVLAPGLYIVEVILPSGQLMTTVTSLEESSVPQSLSVDLEASASEWLRWSGFVGSIDPEQYMTQSMSRGLFFAGGPILRAIAETTTRLQSVSAPRSIHCFFKDGGSGMKQASPSIPDSVAEVYHMGEEGPNEYRAARFDRLFMFTSDMNTPTQYCVLPVPWKLFDGSRAQVDVLVTRVPLEQLSTAYSGYRMAVSVHDKTLGSLIGYLGGGNIPSAREVLNKSVPMDMLFRKLDNPLAAAAGAYVLLDTESDENQDWHGWIQNLMNWFPWLPDGAILHGWALLKGQSISGSDRWRARSSLLKGYRRGVPFFSRGIRLLLDGLVMLDSASEATDDKVAYALKEVWKLAAHTNMRQPFTSGYLYGEKACKGQRTKVQRREAESSAKRKQ